jgi:hypothetical protein
VHLEGLYFHTFTVNGKYMSQGQVVGAYPEYVLVERYGWMEGQPIGIFYIPKVDLKFYTFYRDRGDMVKAYEAASPALKT